jgi:LmbE family N-acetylglucosaminyl deacetylase
MVTCRMINSLFVFLLTLFYSINLYAQTSSEILHKLHKLNKVGSVLYIAAHPDDENTRLLSYLANERKLRTAYLSITRGDGGQNLVGKEQGDLLGLIRTQELLAARRTDGAEQFFTRANDFGYSKSPDETLAFWNKDSTLADMVWIIRQFKPDVIINRFPTTGEGGHGHHTASAMLALEAFDAAANPAMFPEQLVHTQVWQAKYLYWNTFNFSGNNTTSADQLKIDVGAFNTLLGKSYGEIASESRTMHKSQGFGTARQRGELIEYFKQLKGSNVQKDLFEDIDQSWGRIPKSEMIQQTLRELLLQFDAIQPSASVPKLVLLYRQIESLPEADAFVTYWKKQKLKETEELILACSGLWLEASVEDFMAVPGDELKISAQIIHRSAGQVLLHHLTFLNQQDTVREVSLKQNELYTFKQTHRLPEASAYSHPYWLSKPHEIGMYTVHDPKLIGTPENKSQHGVTFVIDVQGLRLNIFRNLIHKTTDPVKGEVYRPFEVIPPATISITEKVYVFSQPNQQKTIQIRVKSHKKGIRGTLRLEAASGWEIDISDSLFVLDEKGDEVILEARIRNGENSGDCRLHAYVQIDNKIYSKSMQRIEYDHIPYQFTLSDASAAFINIDLKLTGEQIGYIPGAGDEVAACLKGVGYQVTELTDEMLRNNDLSVYDAIVTGIRAYNTNQKLQLYYPKLMAYVQQGGNLITQYNTNNRIGPLLAKISPYPFTISRDRVTDEHAKVNITQPEHPVFHTPNEITSTDFEGWIQERGIYFATELDSNYTTVFSMNDKNDKPSEGSLIIAEYGKGNFVYTGIAFFRQLPAGVPGAYRLFVNLLSLPKHR